MKSAATDRDESTSAPESWVRHSDVVFDSLFERSADAIWLYDPQTGLLFDCNQAAVELMGAKSKEQMLPARPEDLSPPVQADGLRSADKRAEIVALVERQKTYRCEWLVRRLDGREVPLEVSSTAIVQGGRSIHVVISRDITERKRAEADLRESEQKFRELFEASTDAISIFDPQTRSNIACNEATVKLLGGPDKDWFLRQPVASLSPERQPDGRLSREVGQVWVERALSHGPQRFEWMARRSSGEEMPVEILLTPVRLSGRLLLVTVSRDISQRKRAEQELLVVNQSLERRVTERTAELSASEARFRALVEHAPEAIVLYSAETGRFLFGNQHACDLYGVPMEKLPELTPADVSPEFQPGGRSSRELAREKAAEVLAGGISVFEWVHRQPSGRLVPTEVRLLRLPAEGQNLIRASIIDNTERKCAERALRESEAKFRALFEGSSQGVVLHDEHTLLEANPAAVRIMRRQSPDELVGKNPRDLAPPFQPNGERSDALGSKYIEECLTRGSARFEWVASDPNGKDVPLEVALTRIEWSGRQVIQAFITDITERKQAEEALREANRELHREIEQRIRAEELLKDRVRMSTLNADVAVALNAAGGLRAMLQQCAELVVRHLDVAFARVWTLNEAAQMLELEASAGCYTHLDGPHSRVRVGQYKIGRIAQEKKPHLTNDVQTDTWVSDREWAKREGMVAFAGYPLLIEDRVLGVLALFARRPLAEGILNTLGSVADSIALGIERKRAQTALTESEARFSAAFQASPIFITISRMSDGRFVLVNDAFVNWSGYTLDEVLERNTAELGLWQRPEDRDAFWMDLRRTGSIRERECLLRNRRGKPFTNLMSANVIQINHVPHLLAMGLDITGRKEAEAELKASEARLRESETRFSVAFQASPVFISIFRVSDEKYVLANDSLLNWLGYSREEVLGRTSLELRIWDDPAERDLVWQDLRTIGSIRQRECRWRNRRGELFTILLSVETITLDNEPHLLSLAVDISQRKQTELELRASEARLRESEARFNVAFRASPVFINILRMSDRRYVWANDAFVARLGYSREEVLGRTSAEFGMWENPIERDRAWEDMRTVGSIRQRECRWLNRRGEPFTILLSAEIIKFEDAPHILSLALDITQRKRAEEELLKALEREKELSKLKSNFVSMVSHEFRTPLGIIQSSAELLRDFFQKMQPSEREEQLESVIRNTGRMAGMMEEILVLSRLDAGKLEFQPATLDFNSFCRRIVDEVLSATNGRCLIELSLAPLPPEARADEQLLGHIFTNLLSNAVKYSEPGAVVRFTIERDGVDAVCVVRDEGIGIAGEDQPHLFEAFHRGRNVGTRPGTGLGLLMVKRCVELHRGNVRLASQLGEGTTVTVRLPLFGKDP
jgi:PAS domain S-box-containing protein